MKIRTKLIASFCIITALLAVVAVIGYWGINRMNTLLDEYAMTEGKLVESAQRSRANINMLRRFEKDAFINIASTEKVAEYSKQWQESYEHCTKRFSVMDSLLANLEKGRDASLVPKFKADIKKLRDGLSAYGSGFKQVLEKIKSGEVKTTQEANTAIGVYKENIHGMEKLTVQIADDFDKMMASGLVEVDEIEAKLVTSIVVISVIAFILTINPVAL